MAEEQIKALEAKMKILEANALESAADLRVLEFLTQALLIWKFEREPAVNYDKFADKMMLEVADMPIPGAPPEREQRIRARLSASIDETLADVRSKLLKRRAE